MESFLLKSGWRLRVVLWLIVSSSFFCRIFLYILVCLVSEKMRDNEGSLQSVIFGLVWNRKN